MDGPDIADLLRRAKAGDEPALNCLCAYMLKWLSKWGHRRLPDWARERNSTADLAQMTVWRFLEAFDRFEPDTEDQEDSLRNILAVIFTNALRDEIRRARRHGLRADEEELLNQQGPEPDALEELIGRHALERVLRALKKLSPEDQELIAMRSNGSSYADIVSQMRFPTAGAARAAFNRARRRLIASMAKDEDE